jgi:hypothetical protein
MCTHVPVLVCWQHSLAPRCNLKPTCLVTRLLIPVRLPAALAAPPLVTAVAAAPRARVFTATVRFTKRTPAPVDWASSAEAPSPAAGAAAAAGLLGLAAPLPSSSSSAPAAGAAAAWPGAAAAPLRLHCRLLLGTSAATGVATSCLLLRCRFWPPPAAGWAGAAGPSLWLRERWGGGACPAPAWLGALLQRLALPVLAFSLGTTPPAAAASWVGASPSSASSAGARAAVTTLGAPRPHTASLLGMPPSSISSVGGAPSSSGSTAGTCTAASAVLWSLLLSYAIPAPAAAAAAAAAWSAITTCCLVTRSLRHRMRLPWI